MNGKLLPADTYIVVNKTVIKEEDKKEITMLYQPIIGHTAVSLYLTLLDDLKKSEIMSDELTHHHLVSTMQLKLQDIVIAREKLEAVGLLKTYVKEENVNNYVYVIYSPLAPSDFLNHPILSVVLYNNLGKKEYDKIVNYYKVPRLNLKDYTDITASFNTVFTSVSGNIFVENDNIVKKNIGNLINALSFTYNIDDLNMQGLVRNCINEKGLIDKEELKRSAREFYEFENAGKLPTLIYSLQPEYLKTPAGDTSSWAKQVYTFENVTPNDYLRNKYKYGEPTMKELQILEELMTKMKMKPGVVNVLISYVLEINNKKFTKNYVEAVASQWCKMNIETVEDAMKIAKKEYKKIKKSQDEKPGKTYSNNSKATESTPEWFNEKPTNNITKKDEEEMQDILDSFS